MYFLSFLPQHISSIIQICSMSFPQPDHSASYGGGAPNQSSYYQPPQGQDSGYPTPGQAPSSSYPNQQQSYSSGYQQPGNDYNQQSSYGPAGGQQNYGQGQSSSYYGGQPPQNAGGYDQQQQQQQDAPQYDEHGNLLPPGERGLGTMALGGAAGFIGNKMTGNHMGGFSSIAGGAMAAQGAKMLYGMFDKNKDHGKPSHNQQYGGGYNQGYQQGPPQGGSGHGFFGKRDI